MSMSAVVYLYSAASNALCTLVKRDEKCSGPGENCQRHVTNLASCPVTSSRPPGRLQKRFDDRTSNAGVAVRTADGSRRTADAGDEQCLRCGCRACSSPSCVHGLLRRANPSTIFKGSAWYMFVTRQFHNRGRIDHLSKTVNSSSSSSSLLDIFAVRGPNHVTQTDKYMRAHKNIKKQSDTK